MSEQHKHDSARDLDAAGVPQEHHDEARALQPLARANGVDWLALLAVLKRHGPEALGVIREVLHLIGRKSAPPEGPGPEKI